MASEKLGEARREVAALRQEMENCRQQKSAEVENMRKSLLLERDQGLYLDAAVKAAADRERDLIAEVAALHSELEALTEARTQDQSE